MVWLDDPRARSPELAGAKAAALAVAASAGLPTLPGVVATTAFDPAGDLTELRTAWASISHGGELPLVVRSSSTIEDTSSSSMAGMFTSILDVSGWEDFLPALDAVLASRNVVPLGEGRGDEGRAARAPMAVLVQPYVAAASGGVLFGLDPVSGRQDRLVVSASEQGPAAVVGGEVDGTQYVLSRRGRRIQGGPGPLGRAQLRRLARLSRRARQVFGGPQDIEWAFDTSGELRLLQSRPVTAHGRTSAARGPVFGPGPVAETFPDALSLLELDLWATPLGDALRQALALAGTTSRRRLAASPVLTNIAGRLAVDLDVLPDSARPKTFLARLDPRPPARRLASAWRIGRLRAALPALATDLIAKADAELLAVDALDGLPHRDLLGLLHASRQGLVALHGHEVLMGWLVEPGAATVTAASVALRQLAQARAEGLADDEIVGRHPGVLALTAPTIGGRKLPDTPASLPAAPQQDADPADPAILREALRLRARWLQELTARAAEELGRRLSAAGLLDGPSLVRSLRLDELDAAVRSRLVPADLAERREGMSAPLPTRFRLTPAGDVVSVQPERRRTSARGARGAGGGRGAGPVEEVSAMPSEGAVLVVATLDPSLAAVLSRLGGLVAETGSPLSHLAILARELGVPTVVGVEGATTRFPPGVLVVVDGNTGEVAQLDEERGAA
ncbi:MAG: PEP/pyruvate-binding domain-containing protein [Acidimicrobiales bacterium]